MRRVPLVRRLLATLLAPWLAVVLAMPEAVHTCAMHSTGHEHVAEAPAPTMAGMAGMHGMSHESAPASASSTSNPGHDTPPCTCPEGCCTVASMATLEVPVSLSWVRVLLDHREPNFPREIASLVTSSDVRLPFANGPPAQA